MNITKTILLILIIMALLLGYPHPVLADTGPGAKIYVSPAASEVFTSTFTVNVMVNSGETGSLGAQCTLSFTPGILECTGIDDGDYYKDWGPLHLGPSGLDAIHNDTGTIDTIGIFATNGDATHGAYNEGVLFVLHFKALTANGSASINIDSAGVSDLNGDPITPLDITSGTVQIDMMIDLSVSKLSPQWLLTSSTYQVNYTIKNDSSITADPSTTGLEIDGALQQTAECPWLAGGDSYSGTFGPIQITDLEDRVRVIADLTDNVTEGQENNNSLQVIWALDTLPKAPSALTAAVQGEQNVKLTWRDNSDNENGFVIERSPSSMFISNLKAFKIAADATQYIDTTTGADQTYYYRIFASNKVGNSEASNVVNITVIKIPDAPTSLTVWEIKITGIRLMWTAPSKNEDGFYVERADDDKHKKNLKKFTVDKSSSETIYYTDTTIKPNKMYYYRVRAYKGTYYSEYSNTIVIDINSAEPQPTKIGYEILDGGDKRCVWVSMHWMDNGEGELGFRIERARDESFTLDKQSFYVMPDIMQYIDKTADRYTEYYYRVFSYNSMGDSDSSDIMHVKTGESPLPPSELKVKDINQGVITLEWKDNSDDETGFHLERSLSEDFSEGTVKLTLTTDNTTYTEKRLQYGRNYYYRVFAYNPVGSSGYSNIITITMPAIPEAPSKLKSSLDEAGNVYLSWKDNADNECGYRIERASDRGFTMNIDSYYIGANINDFVDTKKIKTEFTYYRVYAYNTQVSNNILAESRASNIAYVQIQNSETISPNPDWNTSIVNMDQISKLDLTGAINDDGYVTANVSCQDLNGVKKLEITEGTLAVNGFGQPVRYIEVEPVNMLTLKLAGNKLIGLPKLYFPLGKSMPSFTITTAYTADITGFVYDMEPNGSVFNTPVSLTLTYDPSLCPPGYSTDNLAIAYYDNNTSTWVEVESKVDSRTGTVTADIDHFSIYGVLIKKSPILQLWTVGLLIVLLMGAGLFIVFIIRMRRRRNYR
jgi:hypothetical protein